MRASGVSTSAYLRAQFRGLTLVLSTPSPLSDLIARAESLMHAGQSAAAVREVDRAWRTLPEQRSLLLPVYGRLLALEGQNWAAAIGFLSQAFQADPRPDVAAALIDALHRSGQAQVAREHLDAALRRFALDPAGPLAQQARQLQAAGWAGITRSLHAHVEVAADSGRVSLEIRSSDRAVLMRRIVAARDGRARATLGLHRLRALPELIVTADGEPLLGGVQARSSRLQIDGRATEKRGRIEGWVRAAWNPECPVSLRAIGASAGRVDFCADDPLPGSRWRFALDRERSRHLQGGRLELHAVLDDGTTLPFPDNPLILASQARTRLRRFAPARVSRVSPRLRPVSVIIPVYRGREQTLACIEAVLRTTGGLAASVIVVDDASPEPLLAAELDALAALGQIRLLRNERNRGFSTSVNRAADLCPEHDLLLLNSDVRVFGNWLVRLRAAAYSAARIGTATPFADDDSVAGYRSDASDPVALAEQLDAHAGQAHHGRVADLPVGVGFCMYVRRDCWNAAGAFDAATFPQGYGEEADFCMRARRLGWRHVLAADVFVHHARGSSFGERRLALLDRSRRLLNLRHPGYDQFVLRYAKKDPLQPLRRALDEARLRAQSGPITLILTVGLPGGIDRVVAERCKQLRAGGGTPLVVRPLKGSNETCQLLCDAPRLHELRYRMERDLPTLRTLFSSLPIQAVEIHHFLGLDPRVVELVLGLGVPYDVHLHDYAWICPRVTLIDESRRYCGEPALAACERCVRRNGSELSESISVRTLRRRSSAWLAGARRVIAPSEDTAARFARYFPRLPIQVAPLETFIVRRRQAPGSPRQRVRVAALGAIGHHKGYRVLLDCARDARRRELPLEFVVIGFTENDARLMRTGRIFVTGQYDDRELPSLLQRERPDVVFLPSVWPETWCFTLSQALSAGLPVLAFDLGAIAERIRAEGGGMLLPLDTPAGVLNDRLLELAASRLTPEPGRTPQPEAAAA